MGALRVKLQQVHQPAFETERPVNELRYLIFEQRVWKHTWKQPNYVVKDLDVGLFEADSILFVVLEHCLEY